MSRYAWLKRIEKMQPVCVACGRIDWTPAYIEPIGMIVAPDTPIGHPELKGGMDGKAVLPVTCKHCGYVATYSVEHLENASPWE